ncbi:MAG: hypothetical protein IJC46_08675 [Clostridia bacterium]|nr:hypothetical protein [Clostridia bacterium]
MLKRMIAMLLAGLLVLGVGACSSEETEGGQKPLKEVEGRTYLQAPERGNYTVEYDGRVYTTAGTPFCYGKENALFYEGLGEKLGDTESLGGSFPKGTIYYLFDPMEYFYAPEQVLVAMLPGEEQYYIATSLEGMTAESGAALLKPLFLTESCARFYVIDAEDPTQMWCPQKATEEDYQSFIKAVEEAKATDAQRSGKPLTFMMISYDGLVVQFDLYEGGVLVPMFCPNVALQLEAEMDQWIRSILK